MRPPVKSDDSFSRGQEARFDEHAPQEAIDPLKARKQTANARRRKQWMAREAYTF